MLTALLQPLDHLSVLLYEKRDDYTRSRMVQLDPSLVADSVESFRELQSDQDDVEAIFHPLEIQEGVAFRTSIPADLRSLLQQWTLGFSPLNEIEHSLSSLISERQGNSVERLAVKMSEQDIAAAVEPDDIVIDCTGRNSLLRESLTTPGLSSDESQNTVNLELEHSLVITFLYDQSYSCNELCKYYKNSHNRTYKFIPSVARTFSDGNVSHVTGLVNISSEEAATIPQQCDGDWLRANRPEVAKSMDRFIDEIKGETHGEIVGDLNVLSIPLNLYRARNATNRLYLNKNELGYHFRQSPVILAGDSAIGSPYFQSISLGFECAMYLASLIGQPALADGEMLDLYETYIFKQWLRVYMRSKKIKHDKDIFERVDDKIALLELIHLY
ncbi:unannotated protein [freshwater metagenome]|uniref:Unannotated protein n=2 Tax=freshwater metagenome TaxID=449393 RepID=A0A6J7JJ92_9ZZZZ